MPPEVTPDVNTVPEAVPAVVVEPTESSNEGEGSAPAPTPTEPVYELPDGRQVTGEQVLNEYKNLLKDYTPKSQRLAEYERNQKPPEAEPEWKRPDYVPQSYAEIIEIAEKNALERIRETEIKQAQQQQEIAQAIDAQIAEIKKTDPTLDENALFMHATKYGFRDLVIAHENYRAIQNAKVATEQRTVKNMQTRKEVPVATVPGTAPTSVPEYGSHNRYGSALEFLRSTQQ